MMLLTQWRYTLHWTDVGHPSGRWTPSALNALHFSSVYLRSSYLSLAVSGRVTTIMNCTVTNNPPLSCSGSLRAGLLHWSPVCSALRELLCGHVRRLLGYFASANSGRTGERGNRVVLRDWQVSKQRRRLHIVATLSELPVKQVQN